MTTEDKITVRLKSRTKKRLLMLMHMEGQNMTGFITKRIDVKFNEFFKRLRDIEDEIENTKKKLEKAQEDFKELDNFDERWKNFPQEENQEFKLNWSKAYNIK